jgi:hypothetical protein
VIHGRLLGGISVDDDVTPLDRGKSVQNCSLGKKATTALGLIGVREARASHMLPNRAYQIEGFVALGRCAK